MTDETCEQAEQAEQAEGVYLSSGGTLYYQSPELLVGKVPPSGAHKCDMWAVGCTLYEMLVGAAAFSGETQIQVIHKIHRRMGTDYSAFPEVIAPQFILGPLMHCSAACQSLLMGLLELDALKRMSVMEALAHPFFEGVGEVSELVMCPEELQGRHLLSLKGFHPVDGSKCKFKPVLVEATPATVCLPSDDGGALLDGPATVGGAHHNLVRNLNISDESSIHLVNRSDGADSSSSSNGHYHAATTAARKGFLMLPGGGGAVIDGGNPHLAYSNMRTTALFGDMSGHSSSSSQLHFPAGPHSPAVGQQHGGEHFSVSPRRAVKILQFDQSPTPPPERSAHHTVMGY